MGDDGVRESHGVGSDGKFRASIVENGAGLLVSLHNYSERCLTLAEAKAFRRGLSRLIRRIEQREPQP